MALILTTKQSQINLVQIYSVYLIVLAVVNSRISATIIDAKNRDNNVINSKNVHKASVPVSLQPQALNVVSTQLLPIVTSNLKEKLKVFNTNVKTGVNQFNAAISNNVNAAVAHLHSSISNKINAGMGHFKSSVSHKLNLLNEKIHYLQQKSHAPHLESLVKVGKPFVAFPSTKLQSPTYVSYVINPSKTVHKSVGSKRAKPNKYDALMTDLGISGYKHFENAVIRDLEKREEQKVEATIHTLFENPRHVKILPPSLINNLQSSDARDLHKSASTNSYIVNENRKNNTNERQNFNSTIILLNEKNLNFNTTRVVTDTVIPDLKKNRNDPIEITADVISSNNCSSFRRKEKPFVSKTVAHKRNKETDSKKVRSKDISSAILPSTTISPFKNNNKSIIDNRKQGISHISAGVANKQEFPFKRSKLWYKQDRTEQNFETTTDYPFTPTLLPAGIPKRSKKHTSYYSHRLNRKSSDSYRIVANSKKHIDKPKVKHYRGSIKFRDHFQSDGTDF
ncbi:uncharacterized protein LOC134215951 [Armigeres subalbatus]|uniref:uncharacterized protein LOC134215951 n=1 Tax=Armigeres subalbatus TaxID=124917 RepID=UPI002ED59CAB